jgi:transposase
MDRVEAEAIYDWGRDACVRVLLALASRVERLEGRVGRLEEEVRELRRGSDSSSLPPSADPGASERRRRGRRCGRKPGGQPGHRGSGRGLLPIERVEEVVGRLPEGCRACGCSLAGRPTRGPTRRHQVAELPGIAVRVTEHRLARRRCRDCGTITRAELPPGCSPGSLRAAP